MKDLMYILSPTETFSTNPQYRVTLTDPDDDEDDLCTILIGLLQKDRRKKRKEGLDMLTIGYVIYKVCLLDFLMLLELILGYYHGRWSTLPVFLGSPVLTSLLCKLLTAALH